LSVWSMPTPRCHPCFSSYSTSRPNFSSSRSGYQSPSSPEEYATGS
jgi:hypothetical protein